MEYPIIPSQIDGKTVSEISDPIYNDITDIIYFEGTKEQWANITHSLNPNVTIVYYSETEPTASQNDYYWHYVNVVPVIW